MPRTSARIKIAAVIAAAIEAGSEWYLEGVAALIDGSSGDKAWRRFHDILARAYVLASLEGMAAAFADARIRVPNLPAASGEAVQQADISYDRFARDISVVFEPGPFFEAIQGFEARIPRLRSHVRRLVRESLALSSAITSSEQAGVISALSQKSGAVQRVMSGSFFVSDAETGTIVNLQALVGDALRGGQPKGVAGFIDEAQLMGAHNLTRARLETIYRNNLSSAANLGQVEMVKEPEVRASIPLLVLEEIKDRRTRGNPAGLYPEGGVHWQMDGYVGTVEEFEQRGIIPPNGHNCRGGVRGLTETEAEQRGFVADGQIVPAAIAAHNGLRIALLEAGRYPDPGFTSIGSFAA